MADIVTGAQFAQPDVRGWLTFHDLPKDVQRREDATLAADRARVPLRDYETQSPTFTRGFPH